MRAALTRRQFVFGAAAGVGGVLCPVRWPGRLEPPWWGGGWIAEARGQQAGDVIRASDVMSLRSQVNEVRLRYGLGAYTFTDPTLTPEVTTIRAAHFAELRTALGEVYALAGLAPVYPSGPVMPGNVIRLNDLMETAQARTMIADRPSVVPPVPPSAIYSWGWHEGAQTPDLATYGQVVDAIRLGDAPLLRGQRPYAPAELALADQMWWRTFGDAAQILGAVLALAAAAEVGEAGAITAGAGIAAIAQAIASGSVVVGFVGGLSGAFVTLIGVGLVVFELVAIYFIVRYVAGLVPGVPAVRQVDVGLTTRVNGLDQTDWNSLMLWP
jgi:hypothetical protein